MMAIILVNLLVGPPLFRWALVGIGEAHSGRYSLGTEADTLGGTLAGVGRNAERCNMPKLWPSGMSAVL